MNDTAQIYKLLKYYNATDFNLSRIAFDSSTPSLSTDAQDDSSDLLTWDDATWILSSSFMIFTMQIEVKWLNLFGARLAKPMTDLIALRNLSGLATGFGLLEAGCVHSKNEVNIMMKNSFDLVFGGIFFWVCGYALGFGVEPGSNVFVGNGYYFTSSDSKNMGWIFSTFIFQLSFASVATTIVSGSMAERTNLSAYVVFSLVNTVSYIFPCHWCWSPTGFLYKMGAVDFAGSCIVHTSGGVSALFAAIYLGPRLRRCELDKEGTIRFCVNPPTGGSGVNSVVGLFILWTGWFGFNCGSTFGVSGQKWQISARTSCTTFLASQTAGVTAMIFSFALSRGKQLDLTHMVNGVLGGLVAITAPCSTVRPYESIIIGAVGGLLPNLAPYIVDGYFHIDDPVGAFAVHGAAGMWGALSVGLFSDTEPFMEVTRGLKGLFHGGGFYLLGVQLLLVTVTSLWAAATTWPVLWIIDRFIHVRMTPEEELLGGDFKEHNILPFQLADGLHKAQLTEDEMILLARVIADSNPEYVVYRKLCGTIGKDPKTKDDVEQLMTKLFDWRKANAKEQMGITHTVRWLWRQHLPRWLKKSTARIDAAPQDEILDRHAEVSIIADRRAAQDRMMMVQNLRWT